VKASVLFYENKSGGNKCVCLNRQGSYKREGVKIYMTNYTKKIGVLVTTVAIVANGIMPAAAFADTTITVTGNGADSYNGVKTEVKQETKVEQNNNANFTNNISGNANTGSNDANKNTGGDVNIKTGDASVDATVSNSANTNEAAIDCCASNGNTEIKVAGNGADSENVVGYETKSENKIDQNNDADFDNNVKHLYAKTGNNDANKNTGGDVSVETGDASVKVAVTNWANANSARIGGAHDNGNDVSLIILENGADSDNSIKVEMESESEIDQDNEADFDNNIGGSANSGDNDADKNTGGEVMIETGDATVDVTVDNMANFNWADLNCGCTVGDLTAKIAGNGYDSENAIEGEFESEQNVEQDNDADFNNNVKYLDAETGNNDSDKNTGYEGSDPSIETGDADVTVNAANSANMNSVGSEGPEWPEMNVGGVHVSLDFDLGDLLDALGL
jgi:hypothetical protein